MSGVKKGNIPWNKGITGYHAIGKKKGVCDNTGRTHFGVGHTPWNKGIKNPMSEETKKKISLANKGKKCNLGYKHTQEWKDERSKWAKENSHIYRANGLKGSAQLYKRNPTKIEIIIKKELDKYNINHISQYLINDKFCVDEYLPEYKTVIEVDGEYWHKLDRVVKKDKAENNYLLKCGYRIVRIPEKEVSNFSAASLTSELKAGSIYNMEVNNLIVFPE